MLTEQEILRFIGRQTKHTAGFKQIAHDLAVKGRDRRALEHLLKDLTRQRKLIAIGKDRWGLPTATSSQNLVAGRLDMHRDGYGFVAPEPDSLPTRAKGRLQGDIFIPPPNIGNAMHGDRVLVELGTIRQDGRAEGRILRVTDRKQETVVGIFHYGTHHNYVTPMNERVTMDIIIPEGMEYPRQEDQRDLGTPAPPSHKKPRQPSPHRVLGEEAKQTKWDNLENVVVEVEITQWPSPTQNPRGRVVEILGYEDDFGVDVEIVIRKHHIPHVFPAEVLDEAKAISPVIPGREISRRYDYRHLPIVTIDGETARDFDDAVLVRRLENGHYELQVHIADVAHYIEDGSAIDEEARKRGTSVYFPDRAVPMLPLELSTDLCSLRPNVDRLVLSCIMELDPHGEIVNYQLNEGVICSAQRMTYTDVNAIIEGDQHLRRKYSSLADNFQLMYELAQVLNRKRAKRGSIDFDLPEPVIEFDEFGLMKSIAPSERNWAHRLIEEFMLAANETVASHLEQMGVASIYRIHEKPEPKRIYEFENIAASFGYSLGVGAIPVKRMQMRSDKRARYGTGKQAPIVELPQDIHITPSMYQKLVQKIAGKPEERILSFLMLRSLKQARYSEKNEGHFALAAPSYTHFTSPIRRYPDLIVHRIFKAVLREKAETEDGKLLLRSGGSSPWRKSASRSSKHSEPLRTASAHAATRSGSPTRWGPIPEEELREIAESSSQSERAADEAERELLEWKKMKFMEKHIGEEYPGLVVSVTKFGLFVELEDLFVEGLVPLNSLDDDHYTFRENTRQIIGARSRKTYSIGDKIKVLVDRIDRMQRKIQFAIVEEKPSRAQTRHRRRH